MRCAPKRRPPATAAPDSTPATTPASNSARGTSTTTTEPGRMLRVRADTLDRLLSLSGRIAGRIALAQTVRAIDAAREARPTRREPRARSTARNARRTWQALDPRAHAALEEVRRLTAESQHQLAERLADLENFDRRSTHLSQQLYDDALRMPDAPVRRRAPADFARMVRDVARSLGKEVRWRDRRRNDAGGPRHSRSARSAARPSAAQRARPRHRNARRAPRARQAARRHASRSTRVTAPARCSSRVTDDGARHRPRRLRRVDRAQEARERRNGRASLRGRAARIPVPARLLACAITVTDVSGRGVGLDAVHDVVQRCAARVRVTQEPGVGTRFQLQLPLTLSVIRSLLVEVGGRAVRGCRSRM